MENEVGKFVESALRRDEEIRFHYNHSGDEKNILYKRADTIPKVAYLCDRRKCEKCNPECTHTTDIRHAENFRVSLSGRYIEIGEAKK